MVTFCSSVSLDNNNYVISSRLHPKLWEAFRRENGKRAPQGMSRQHSTVPTVKLLEKLLLTPCPALSKTNDLLHQHGGDLSYEIMLSTLAFCAFYLFQPQLLSYLKIIQSSHMYESMQKKKTDAAYVIISYTIFESISM